MTPAWNELPISLEKLDDHIKALLRLKIREFVHLSPWFKDVPSVDPIVFAARESSTSRRNALAEERPCPHRKLDGKVGRRVMRGSLHLNGII